MPRTNRSFVGRIIAAWTSWEKSVGRKGAEALHKLNQKGETAPSSFNAIPSFS
jgi:hypothetical protein